MPTAGRSKWLAYAIVTLVGGMFIYIALAPGENAPDSTGNPDAIAKLRCVAKAVALHQQVYAQAETGSPFPDYLEELEDRVNRLHRYVRGLTQSNDPASTHFRPIMIEEETARDSAVAVDAEGYMRKTWPEVQACDTFYNGDLPH